MRALNWETDRADWPNAEFSSFEQADGIRWHVQRMGQGPSVLLLHGTGASTHSWASLAPRLAKHFSIVAPDLPGHGFSEPLPRPRLSLSGMAASLAGLLDTLSIRPRLVVGHSAGAAILIRCCLDRSLTPDALVSINGALLPFRGAAGLLFPPMARLLFANPLAARILAARGGDRDRVLRLIRGTGSDIDSAGIQRYARLFSCPGHVAATLGMMASWDLQRLSGDLPGLRPPLMLMVGENDRAVAPSEAVRIKAMLPAALIERLAGLGHLAHEEDPALVEASILSFAARHLTDRPGRAEAEDEKERQP